MYDKRTKKNIKPEKRVKFTKKTIEPIVTPPVVEPKQEHIVQKIEPVVQVIEATPVIFHTYETPEIKIKDHTPIKKTIKTKIKKPHDKTNLKKAKFKKETKPVIKPETFKTPDGISTLTYNVQEKPVIIKVPSPPKDEPVIISTPFIVEFEKPKIPKKNKITTEIYEYTFNNYENKNNWTINFSKTTWHNKKLPLLDKWIVDYYHPKNNETEWFKIVHYFSKKEINKIPPFSPDINNNDGCK